MCGIAGFLSLSRHMSSNELKTAATRMSNTLFHRGPDDGGVWIDQDAGVALAHRRLSIVDLSPEGHQPMSSACGRFIISFNGEIYNYLEIQKELGSVSWRGHSDTEVMLAAIARWGIQQSIVRFNGMFAFALWDREERSLYLVRDRLGEKPLYYGFMGNSFLFGSELKALRAHSDFRGEIDRDALILLMRYNCIPTPYSIYKGIFKLPPGTILKIAQDSRDLCAPIPYWSAKEVAELGIANPFNGTERDAIIELDKLLREAIGLRMLADVPLGAFLSGGIDSSTIVALMQAQSYKPVKTFSIGFHEDSYNEANHAKRVAQYLGTEHTELYVTSEEAMAVIPTLPTLYDEPFSDSSQIPTFLVSSLAKKHVTVCLSGDAGDELFGGYNRYFWGRRIWNSIGWMPASFRNTLARALTAISPETWDQWFSRFGELLPAKLKQRQSGDKLHKLAEVLAVESPKAMYRCLVSHWKQPGGLVLEGEEPANLFSDQVRLKDSHDFTDWMMYMDLVSYLLDDILVKIDRASMSVNLEARVPFLDHRIVEFAWKIPLEMKLRDGEGKWLLRQVLYKYVPKELIERPKWGFGIPLDTWLRGPLREWAETLLGEQRLNKEGFFNSRLIREKWQEHLSGKRNWQYHLWDVLVFQAWLDGSDR